MKSYLLLIACIAVPHISQAQYWNMDLRLPRLPGVKKVVVTEPGSSIPPIRQSSKMVLLLNKDGLVSREENYESGHTQLSSYTRYEYIGADTQATTIRVFTYPLPGRGKVSQFVQTVEFVDDHANPRHHEWRYYQLDTAGKKHLLNITATDYDATGRAITGRYTSMEAMAGTDSTSYSYHGDTVMMLEYHLKGRYEGGSQSPQQPLPEVLIIRKDSVGRTLHAERIAHPLSGMLRTDDFFYDKRGRYIRQLWEQEYNPDGKGWLKGEERRIYDNKSRLRSLIIRTNGKVIQHYTLTYFP